MKYELVGMCIHIRMKVRLEIGCSKQGYTLAHIHKLSIFSIFGAYPSCSYCEREYEKKTEEDVVVPKAKKVDFNTL